MSPLDLPTEVRFLIIKNLCPPSLRNMALVWRDMIPEIRRLLFHDIRIHSMKLDVRKCLQDIQNKPPEIRSLVHTFYLRSFSETMSDFLSFIAPRTLVETFPNVEALEFDHVSVDALERANFAGMLGIHQNVSTLMLKRGDYTLAKFLAILACFPNLRVIELVWFYVTHPDVFINDHVDYPAEPAIVDFDAYDLPNAPVTLSLEKLVFACEPSGFIFFDYLASAKFSPLSSIKELCFDVGLIGPAAVERLERFLVRFPSVERLHVGDEYPPRHREDLPPLQIFQVPCFSFDICTYPATGDRPIPGNLPRWHASTLSNIPPGAILREVHVKVHSESFRSKEGRERDFFAPSARVPRGWDVLDSALEEMKSVERLIFDVTVWYIDGRSEYVTNEIREWLAKRCFPKAFQKYALDTSAVKVNLYTQGPKEWDRWW